VPPPWAVSVNAGPVVVFVPLRRARVSQAKSSGGD
jgi:hypothetical protein